MKDEGGYILSYPLVDREKGDFMAKKTVTVTRESSSGRNTGFHDSRTDADMTRSQFVRQIEQGNYPDYHVRMVNGVKTPASNPDGRSNNNLG